MKKTLKTSFIYLIIALVAGVFFREFTKFFDYTAHTSLGVMHTHLFILGTFVFLLLTLFLKGNDVSAGKKFKRFFITYNAGVIFFVVMLLTRGILQVANVTLSNGINAMISGIAGISHIFLTVGLVLLYPVLKETLTTK